MYLFLLMTNSEYSLDFISLMCETTKNQDEGKLAFLGLNFENALHLYTLEGRN